MSLLSDRMNIFFYTVSSGSLGMLDIMPCETGD